jgi:CRP/FNR family transcriptional regulator
MITEQSLINRITDSFPFLRDADPAFVRYFFQRAQRVSLSAGQQICSQGSECSSLALLLDGRARVYKLGENGREITLYRLGVGESCILTASCILSQVPFPAYAVCETDVEAVVIPVADVKRWMGESEAWREYLFGLISGRFADVISMVEEVAFRRVDRRIAALLVKRASESGDEIAVTHQEIASDLGSSREVVSRILKDFETMGHIKVSRGHVQLLDMPWLQKKSDEGGLA